MFRKVTKTEKFYLEFDFLKYWPGMLLGLEFSPRKAHDGFELLISLTVCCISLFQIEFCLFKKSLVTDGNVSNKLE